MNRPTAIKLNNLVGQIVMAARELEHGSRHSHKTLINEIESHRASIGEVLVHQIEDSFKPKLSVAAYTAKGEEHPVLQVYVNDHGTFTPLSMVYRRGEPMYTTLLNACCGSPEWMYGESPKPLI